MNYKDNTDFEKKIKKYALSSGIDLIGIASLKQLKKQKETLENWLSAGMNADMQFLERNIEKRSDLSLFAEDAKSVIVAGVNYFPAKQQGGNGVPVISKYAYGKEYQTVVGSLLKNLLGYIISLEPSVKGKICVDTSPVFEKSWAYEAGLGWIGRNSLLINSRNGSFIFLGEIVLNIELKPDNPVSEDFCASCGICVDSCPTGAINDNKTIDARKCISWLTVENKKTIPEIFRSSLNDRIFGCDICQDVCPWNAKLKPHNNPDFKLSEKIEKMSKDDWNSISEEDFKEIFESSSLKRTSFPRIKRNIDFISPKIN